MDNLQRQREAFTAEQLFREINAISQTLVPPLHAQPWYIKAPDKPSVTLTKLLPRKSSQDLLFKITVPKDEAVVADFQRWMTSTDRPGYASNIRMIGYSAGREAVEMPTP